MDARDYDSTNIHSLQIELVENESTKKPFDPTLTVAMSIHEEGIRQEPGLMLYPGTGSADGWVGDHVIIAPPYTVTEDQLEMIVAATYKAVNAVCERIRDG